MRKIVLFLLSLSIFNYQLSIKAFAQSPQEYFSKAKVLDIKDQGTQNIAGYENPYQLVELAFIDGPQAGTTRTIEHGGIFTITNYQLVKPGDIVVVSTIVQDQQAQNTIIDKYRLDPLLWITGGFFLLVLVTAGLKKGLGSIIGLAISLAIITKFIVPQILAGRDPIAIALIGSIVMLVTTMYLAHGFHKQTSIAVLATAITLSVTGILSVIFVNLTKLSGLGSEDATSLQIGLNTINFRGLLLGGMMIGALGVLDDITTGQTAAVYELHKANPSLHFLELIKRARKIGTEHIASLVNTLVMAYAGASLALFIILVMNPSHQPLWVIFNSELIAEEIVRTLAGSIGLILAVPITTVLAATVVTREHDKSPDHSDH